MNWIPDQVRDDSLEIIMKQIKLITGLLTFLFIFSPMVLAESFDVSYTSWNKVLDSYLKDGKVNYKALQKSQTNLDDFLSQVKTLDKKTFNDWDDENKIAFWLNLYNASAMKIILDNYPINGGGGFKASFYPKSSIQRIKKVWDRKFIDVFGDKISLNHIENKILRKKFKEPRIHFALVCASIGCPVLRGEAYMGGSLDEQLTDQTRNFLAVPFKNRYEVSENTFYMSPIFKWFSEDFESFGGPVAFAKEYVSSDIQKQLTKKTEVKFLDYDWSLNALR